MRPCDAMRLAYGTALLVAPERLAHALTGMPLDGGARVTARVLGVRHMVQALVVMRTDRAVVRRLGRWLDALHSASMIALAVTDAGRRRLALADSVVAALFSVSGTTTPRGR